MMPEERRPSDPPAQAGGDRTPTRPGALYWVWKFAPGLLLLGLMLLAGILWVGIAREKANLAKEKAAEIGAGSPASNVVVQRLIPVTVEDRLSLPATVEPWTDLNLLAQIHGRVIEIPVKPGERVEAGEVIARVDSRDYELAVASARASYDLAAAEQARVKDLFDRGLVSKSEMDRASSSFDALDAALRNAEIQLERCTLSAPISGVINRLDVEIGSLLKDGDPVGQIHELDRVKVVVGIPEADVTAVRKLDRVPVVFPALGDRRYTGRTYALTSESNSLARLYRLELEVRNPEAEILPSMFGRAEVVKARKSNTVAVPLYAVISRQDSNFVLVVNGNHASRREVELGILEDWKIEITKGLEPGDRVIVVGHRNVNDGQEVSVVREVTDPSEILR